MFALTTTAAAQADSDSTDTGGPTIYLGVNAGAEFADPTSDENEFQLTGAIAYQFPMGLFIEYEGGIEGGEYVGWTRAGWALEVVDPLTLVGGVDNVYDGSQAYGAFASAFLEIMEGRAARVTVDGTYDIDVEEFSWGTRVGFYLLQ